jgi:hypothetical protein
VPSATVAAPGGLVRYLSIALARPAPCQISIVAAASKASHAGFYSRFQINSFVELITPNENDPTRNNERRM